MSKYTTEVRYICESSAGLTDSAGYNSIDSILETAAPLVFNFDFPIFDENYRPVLEKKILKHYYTREICEETVGLWKLRLDDRMNLIMPYYNKLYESELIKFNPLYDVDISRLHQGESGSQQTTRKDGSETVTGDSDRKRTEVGGNDANRNRSQTTEGETTNNRVDSADRNANKSKTEVLDADSTNNTSSVNEVNQKHNETSLENNTADNLHWDLYSDTPQGGINGIEGEAFVGDALSNNTYLTNARKVSDDGKSNGTRAVDYQGKEKGTSNDTGTSSVDSTTTVTESEKIEKTNNTSEIGKAETSVDESERVSTTNTLSENITDSKNEIRSSVGNGSMQLSNTDSYIEHVTGKQGSGSYSKLLKEFRDTFLNIDKMIIKELSDLFFGLW